MTQTFELKNNLDNSLFDSSPFYTTELLYYKFNEYFSINDDGDDDDDDNDNHNDDDDENGMKTKLTH
ncbi:unnamed protein product [Schistosoma mattheei]|uniref:Uncharacterized protein n=1 Tax=Schistosoma mattheei TaxID=31246 RepID=A0A183PQB7_9TREM|nr:unnamed protein product [Schistosoma mattheei]